MTAIPRHRTRGVNWRIEGEHKADGSIMISGEQHVLYCLLMDIRDELKELNALMQCHNVAKGFTALQQINKRMGKFDALKLRRPRRK